MSPSARQSGTLYVSAAASTARNTSTAGGRGFTAIIVAWLAQFNTLVMVLISFLLVFLQKGASQIASQFKLNEFASNVITGIIKANIPTRIAFSVASQVDSRTMIDHGGAEKLLGNGDMLFVPSGINKPMRVQGAWVSDQEVHAVTEYIKQRQETPYDEDVVEKINQSVMSDAEKEEAAEEYDPRLPEAVEIVIEAGQASISMLQRRIGGDIGALEGLLHHHGAHLGGRGVLQGTAEGADSGTAAIDDIQIFHSGNFLLHFVLGFYSVPIS